MDSKARKVVNFAKRNAGELVAGATLLYVLYRLKGHRLVPIEGHFIRKADFQRLLTTDDKLVLLTPLGEFRVTPVL